MRLSRPALLLALALAACGGAAPEAPAGSAARGAVAAPVAMSQGTGVEDGYAACRERAAGRAPGLIACADSAVAAAGQKFDSAEAAAAFRAALAKLGDEAAESGGTAAQVTFAHAAVQAARQRALLLSGSAHGTAPAVQAGEPGGAWATSRAISCREHPVPQCAARYDALLSLLRTQAAREPATTHPAPAKDLPLPSCDEIKAGGEVGEALADTFYARYPKSLAGEASVEQVALDPAALDNVVRYLVCVAGATQYDPVVAENGLALFASKLHGVAARRRLSALAHSGDPAAGAARRLDAQITGHLQESR
ncbi:hypothetical protein [Sphingomonas sp.]|uniref:hypothetical protein n=1 Tax=Sphingomonas sp. TaxID=28214 RepID=UPI002FD8E237